MYSLGGRAHLWLVVLLAIQASRPAVGILPRPTARQHALDASTATANLVKTSANGTTANRAAASTASPPSSRSAENGTGPAHAACPPHWERFERKCYRVYNESVYFLDAILACRYLLDRAHLLSIASAPEQRFVDSLIARHRLRGVWLNVVGFPDDEFRLVESSQAAHRPLAYSNWAPDEPRFQSGRENCAMIVGSTSGPNWMNVRCTPFLITPKVICQRSALEPHEPAPDHHTEEPPLVCGNDDDEPEPEDEDPEDDAPAQPAGRLPDHTKPAGAAPVGARSAEERRADELEKELARRLEEERQLRRQRPASDRGEADPPTSPRSSSRLAGQLKVHAQRAPSTVQRWSTDQQTHHSASPLKPMAVVLLVGALAGLATLAYRRLHRPAGQPLSFRRMQDEPLGI